MFQEYIDFRDLPSNYGTAEGCKGMWYFSRYMNDHRVWLNYGGVRVHHSMTIYQWEFENLPKLREKIMERQDNVEKWEAYHGRV